MAEPPPRRRRRLLTRRTADVRRARALLLATSAYNAVEAGVAVAAGLAAGSVALMGFGLDSAIEIAASLAAWRRVSIELQDRDAEALERTERRVGRFVGASFVALSLYVLVESVLSLTGAAEPRTSWVGIGLAVASLLIMPGLALAKTRVAARLGSHALRSEAKETLACAWLSLTLLLGLALNAAFGWAWADPVAALAMIPWLLSEAREAWEGEDAPDGD